MQLLWIKRGEVVIIRIPQWNPESEVGHWTGPDQNEGGKWEFPECAGRNCVYCLEGNRPQVRFKIVVLHDGEEKFLYCVPSLYQKLLGMKARHKGNFLRWHFEIYKDFDMRFDPFNVQVYRKN